MIQNCFTCFLSVLQNFLSYLIPSLIGINWVVYCWRAEGPQLVVFRSSLPCQVPLLDWSSHITTSSSTSLKHNARPTIESPYCCCWQTAFYKIFLSTVFVTHQKLLVCRDADEIVAHLVVAFLWLPCCELYLLLKPSSVKINKTLKSGETLILWIATLQPCFCFEYSSLCGLDI